MYKTCIVIWDERVEVQLDKVPRQIREKFSYWVDAIRKLGIHEVRKIPGYHDEPLQGNRFGQRSVRLNRSYRAIYKKSADDIYEIIEVIEVNKHDY